ncbi:hypothetical protein X797_012452 [Metarhizium robertsii]|uniref:Uncharacterized protein n=1 Tax=Metarhizium robertsii TaxID=568076 RepID=A0A014NZU5_9HYPO|nr:hypothetical protein X797_012452 [Metarhizium robertsii]
MLWTTKQPTQTTTVTVGGDDDVGRLSLSRHVSEISTNTLTVLQAPESTSVLRLCRQPLTQHKLLVQLQSVLEAACYEFGKYLMPDIFRRRGWDCAESLELNRCAREFQQWSFSDVESANKPRDELFRSISNIRHTAVHRLRVSVDAMEQFFNDAETLLLLLGDDARRRGITMLRQESRMITAKTKESKHPLHSAGQQRMMER